MSVSRRHLSEDAADYCGGEDRGAGSRGRSCKRPRSGRASRRRTSSRTTPTPASSTTTSLSGAENSNDFHQLFNLIDSQFRFQHTSLVDKIPTTGILHVATTPTPAESAQQSFHVQVLRAVVVQGAQDLLQSQHFEDDGGERRP